jgi:cyclophilin family peptidyl-prolyl cis-trans isomerase
MANPTVTLNTSKGPVAVELFADRAPKSVENFLQYAREGHYAGTVFHRVIPGFMVQGGGFTPDLQQKPTRDPIENEADNGLKNERGTLAMARTSDIQSATSQFFINVADNDFLNHGGRDFGYAVFGRVTDGMDVVDAIVDSPTGAKGPFAKDCPVEDITIDSVTID